MGRTFDIEYDDFSGGYYVNRSVNAQPRETWTGVDAVVEPGTGYLMANDPWYKNTAATVTPQTGNIVQTNGGVYMATASAILANTTANSATVGPQGFTAANTVYTPTSGTPNPAAPLVLFNNQLVIPATSANVIVMPLTGPASTLNATPVALTTLGVYDYWLFGSSSASATPNRAYYCAPSDPTSWSSGNYYDIGDPSNTVQVIIAHQGQVFFGGTQGWYVGYGVPGSTFSLRKINAYPAAPHAVDADTRIFVPSVLQEALLAELAGQQVVPINWAGAATAYVANAPDNVVSRLGSFVATIAGVNGATSPTNIHLFNLATRTWNVVSQPSGSATGLIQIGGGQESANTLVGHDGANLFYRWPVPPFPRCGFDFRAGDYTSCTVVLADYFMTGWRIHHKEPFRVREVICDVEADFNTAGKTRQLGVRVLANFSPDQQASIDPATQRRTEVMKVAAGGQRQTMRFNTNDALSAYYAAVELTIQGLKVRRVVMRCEAASND